MTRNIETGTTLIHLRDNGEIVTVERQSDEATLQEHLEMFESFLKAIGFSGVTAIVAERDNMDDVRSDPY